MTTNPVEANPVTRWLLGMAVILAMMVGGGAVGWLARDVAVPYADLLGTLAGAVVVFSLFVVLYRRYHAGASDEEAA
jgi:hypothetical protein